MFCGSSSTSVSSVSSVSSVYWSKSTPEHEPDPSDFDLALAASEDDIFQEKTLLFHLSLIKHLSGSLQLSISDGMAPKEDENVSCGLELFRITGGFVHSLIK